MIYCHFDLLKDGTEAIFVTPHCSGKTRLDVFPVNMDENTIVTVELKDAEGNIVGSAGAKAKEHMDFIIDVKEPHLWDGMAYPYLYIAVAKLVQGETVVDTVEVSDGYRSFRVDVETGFWLNGKNVPLRGVSRHQDRLDKGWAISNEILVGVDSEQLRSNLRAVADLAKSMDPSRLTTIAQVNTTPIDSEHNYMTDLVSYNHYFGWYRGEVGQNGPWLDEFHRVNPDVAIGLSEYGVENILKWHSATPMNHDYTEEYANYYHHEMLKTFETRPWLWSTHVWNCFDFAADARDEGGVKGRNNKGLITYDRKIKKHYSIYKL